MNEPMEERTYRGYTIEINQDVDAGGIESLNPRSWENLGTMACYHRDYELGDWQISKDTLHRHGSWDEVADWIEETEGGVAFKPLKLLDHSGLWMKTTGFRCDPGGWDSSMVGWIYTTEEEIEGRKELLSDPEELDVGEQLEEEVELYSHWLAGEVFYYTIKDGNGDFVDTLSGFYGFDWEDNGLMDRAREMVDHEIKERREARQERLKELLVNDVPEIVREEIMNGFSDPRPLAS